MANDEIDDDDSFAEDCVNGESGGACNSEDCIICNDSVYDDED